MPSPASIKTILQNKHLSLALLKPYFSLALLLLTGFTVASVGVGALERNTETHSNPFEVYLDIFPGQPMSAVVERGFSCFFVPSYYKHPAQNICTMRPPAGIFSGIGITGSVQSVWEIRFILSEKTLRLGDVLVMFGLPQYHSYAQTTFVFWRDYYVSAPTSGGANVNPVSQSVLRATFTLSQKIS